MAETVHGFGLKEQLTITYEKARAPLTIENNEKKIMKCLPSSQTRPKISVPPPLTRTYLAQHSNAVLSVTLETVNLDLK